MKYYIKKNKSEFIVGEPLNGIISICPMIKDVDGNLIVDPQYIEVDIEETDDLYVKQIWYKYLDGNILKMEDSEVRLLYPELFEEPKPSPEEQQTDFNLDVDYRLSCIELGLI